MSDYVFIDLTGSDLTTGEPFEGFKAGTHTDMSGKTYTFTDEDVQTIFDGTVAAIEATRAPSGEVVGLPIDAKQHERGDAAGWIVGVEKVGNVLKFIPRWTDLGVELIRKGLQRLFSASIDLKKLAVVGGSLTNWPAVKGLQPVQLSEGVWHLQKLAADEAMGERERRVRGCFRKKFPMSPEGPGVSESMFGLRDVMEQYCVVEDYRTGDLWKAGYKDGEEDFEFDAQADWVRVRMVPKEFSDTGLWDRVRKLFGSKPEPSYEEVANMDLTQEQMDALATKVAELVKPAVTPEAPDVVGLEAARLGMEAQFQKALQDQYALMTANANKMLADMVANIARESETTNFVKSVTDGSQGLALPVKPEDLTTFLKALPDAQRKQAMVLFGQTISAGLVDFAEAGHTKDGKTLLPLPEGVAAQLDKGLITVADLATDLMTPMLEGHSPSEYDLSKWAKEA